MARKQKKQIITQQKSSEGEEIQEIKKRSGKPKGIKHNILPKSGQWTEEPFLRQLVVYLTIIGRINNLHQTGTLSKKQGGSSDQKNKLKNQNRKLLAQICQRLQKSDGTIVFFLNTRQLKQNLDELQQEIDFLSYDIKKTIIEKLGQMLDISFIREIVDFIKQRPEEPFLLFKEGGLERQQQVVQCYFVKYFLENHDNQPVEAEFIRQEFEEFKKGVDEKKILQIYQQIAQHFYNHQDQYQRDDIMINNLDNEDSQKQYFEEE